MQTVSGLRNDDTPQKRKVPKSNKLRSKECRERKRRYITILEDKIRNLMKENELLKHKNFILSQSKENSVKTDITQTSTTQNAQMSFEHPLFEYEHFLYEKLYPGVRENPDEIRFSTLEQTSEHTADYSNERIDFIKKAFRDIISNVASLQTKTLQSCHKNMHVSEWIKKCKAKRNQKYTYKTATTPEDIFLEHRFSEGVQNFLEKDGRSLATCRRKIQRIVQKLIEARNQLFNIYNEMKKIYEKSTSFAQYKKSDISQTSELIEKLQNQNFLTPHFLWSIPKKTHDEDVYRDGELTE
ncbi:unnamed protein product [Moneuplotes crassus]|uniref:BZIP domain-containing protein n=1 Tax=Euplotes crassus TaxID=5936 RepID=A0AAD2CWV5_EUPCR|nr:unnamed protein product [Moneuplotes crassus]